MRVCFDCLGDPERANCPTCNGRGLLLSLTTVCPECCGGGKIGRLRCPKCKGSGSTLNWIPAPPAPRLVTAEELRTAFRETAGKTAEEESYAIGVACGLHAAALDRYPEEPERRADWLSRIAERGVVVLDIDGIWHSADGKAARLISFDKYK